MILARPHASSASSLLVWKVRTIVATPIPAAGSITTLVSPAPVVNAKVIVRAADAPARLVRKMMIARPITVRLVTKAAGDARANLVKRTRNAADTVLTDSVPRPSLASAVLVQIMGIARI